MATIDTFPYHRQDDEAMCGPACAQMVLDYLKQELPSQINIRLAADSLKEATATIWQNYEYDGWATRPDELGYALLPLGQAISITFTAQYKGNPSKYKTLLSTDSINHSDSPAYPIVPVHGTFYYKQQFGDYIEASGYSDLAERILTPKAFMTPIGLCCLSMKAKVLSETTLTFLFPTEMVNTPKRNRMAKRTTVKLC
ncbi:MAG: hypothetical protein U0X75_13325 [Acidobacteriota bacterium]